LRIQTRVPHPPCIPAPLKRGSGFRVNPKHHPDELGEIGRTRFRGLVRPRDYFAAHLLLVPVFVEKKKVSLES
jgi:hypothetical protein